MSLRILHAVEFYAPSVGGAQEVVRQVSERLAARGHQVTVATTRLPGRRFRRSRGVDVAEFDIRGNAVRGMTGEVGAYQRFVQDGAFDVVMTYAAQQWTTDALLPVLEGVTGARILAPCGFSALRRPEYSAYFDRLRVDLHRFDALIFHSGTYQDFRFAQDAGVATGVVIPNAADEREFAELNGVGLFRAAHRLRNDVPLLLTVGGHTGLKGHAQTMSAFRRTRRARGRAPS